MARATEFRCDDASIRRNIALNEPGIRQISIKSTSGEALNARNGRDDDRRDLG
jgi:hypothetical protein